MAHTLTATVTFRTSIDTTTSKPKLKLAVPFFKPKPKQPWEGLLMGDPGPDYDHHEVRLEFVDYMLTIAAESRNYAKARNWRNMPVFDDDEDDKPAVKRAIHDDARAATGGRTETTTTLKTAEDDQKSVWHDPSSTWREKDAMKQTSQMNEHGLFYGKPW